MTTTRTVLRGKHTATHSDLYMSFELGDKRWQITIGDGQHSVSRYTVAAGHTAGITDCIVNAGARFKTGGRAQVHSCYEAGRDGWWLHRWLSELGVDNVVVDPASIEVNRRARRAKTDRLDADKLLAMLVRHHAGEHVWSVLREPSPEDEDERRVHRELQRLMHERIAHTNRIGSLLVLHNLRPTIIVGGREWAAWWDEYREHVPPMLRSEIEREVTRLKLVKEQVRAIEKELATATERVANDATVRSNLVRASEALMTIVEQHSLARATVDAFASIKDKVSAVFAQIHSPPEYELGDFSNDSLIIRRDNGQRHAVSQVSTGQRAALALSIFLALNDSAKTAPPIILIDDPVAHIDDLNALSFLDYLREVVLRNRKQLFFATADIRLAALFQRKFEFLGSQRFQRISLSQESGGAV